MGYQVEQTHQTQAYLSTFATTEAMSGYHTAASLEQDVRRLAESAPEIVELRPRTTAEGGFLLPSNQIQPTWEENLPAALEFIRRVL
jgi:hypothetical protein